MPFNLFSKRHPLERIIFLLITLLIATTASAQSSRKATKRKAAMQTEKPAQPQLSPEEEQRLLGMEKVLIFDSLVISKAALLQAIPLSPSSGTLAWDAKRRIVHTVSLGDERFQSTTTDSTHTVLTHSILIQGQWTEPETFLPSSVSDSLLQDTPFMMPDGLTLYFAQQGEGGDLDIYMTQRASCHQPFYQPEEIGLPFNSTANDYMYAIDEETGIGCFASDRRQPADSVCVYYFQLSPSRAIYDAQALSIQERIALSQINSIAATWDDTPPATLNALRQRLKAMLKARR